MKNNQQILNDEENFESEKEVEEIMPEEKSDEFFSQLDSISTVDIDDEVSVGK